MNARFRIDRYCLHCRKLIPFNKNGDYCSRKCETVHEEEQMKRQWESISIKKNVKQKLADIQQSIKTKKISFSDIIDLLIETTRKHGIDIEKEYNGTIQ